MLCFLAPVQPYYKVRSHCNRHSSMYVFDVSGRGIDDMFGCRNFYNLPISSTKHIPTYNERTMNVQ